MVSLVESYFDGAAKTYETVTLDEDGWAIPYIAEQMLGSISLTGSSALSVGAGSGKDVAVLRNLGVADITMLDISAKMLALGQEKYPDVKAIHGDFMDAKCQLPIVSVITALGVLEFIGDEHIFFKRVSSLLSDAGVALVTYEPIITGYPPQSSASELIHSSDQDPRYACKGVHVYRRSPLQISASIKSTSLEIVDHQLCRAYDDEHTVFYGALVVRQG